MGLAPMLGQKQRNDALPKRTLWLITAGLLLAVLVTGTVAVNSYKLITPDGVSTYFFTETNSYQWKQVSSYTIDSDGFIDMPVIGKMKVGGMTRLKAEQTIQARLREEQLKDATVTVDYVDLRFTVLGEVMTPGVYFINKDLYTLTDALGSAGGMTTYGKRDSVMVIRQTPQGKRVFVVNLNTGRDLFSSEAFYIHQNDIVNVKANNTKARQSLANGNETRSISFWTSIVSLAATLAMLIFK
jgi:polysaccharide export outer membrane protein